MMLFEAVDAQHTALSISVCVMDWWSFHHGIMLLLCVRGVASQRFQLISPKSVLYVPRRVHSRLCLSSSGKKTNFWPCSNTPGYSNLIPSLKGVIKLDFNGSQALVILVLQGVILIIYYCYGENREAVNLQC